jgi:hypothetical protein
MGRNRCLAKQVPTGTGNSPKSDGQGDVAGWQSFFRPRFLPVPAGSCPAQSATLWSQVPWLASLGIGILRYVT